MHLEPTHFKAGPLDDKDIGQVIFFASVSFMLEYILVVLFHFS